MEAVATDYWEKQIAQKFRLANQSEGLKLANHWLLYLKKAFVLIGEEPLPEIESRA